MNGLYMMGVVPSESVTNRSHIMQQNFIEFRASFKFWQSLSLISSFCGGSILVSFDGQRSISKYVNKSPYFPQLPGHAPNGTQGAMAPTFFRKQYFCMQDIYPSPETDIILACLLFEVNGRLTTYSWFYLNLRKVNQIRSYLVFL